MNWLAIMWELLTYIVIATLSTTPLWRDRVSFAVVVLLGLLTVGCSWYLGQESTDKPSFVSAGQNVRRFLPHHVDGQEFEGSAACKSCHPKEHDSWHHTFHRTMTQVASPKSVVGPFDDIHLNSRDGSYHLQRRKDEFWVSMPNLEELRAIRMSGQASKDPRPEELPRVERRIVMTTGSHRMQAYWFPSSKGRELLQLPWMYSIEIGRWIPADYTFIKPPDNPTTVAAWNLGCINCHAVNGEADRKLESRVAELGISCEACHGPGQSHIKRHRNIVNRYLRTGDDSTIVNPSKVDAVTATQICGQCHSAFGLKSEEWWNGGGYRAGGDFDAAFHQFAIDDPGAAKAYWGDGTMRIGGREYLALTASECFKGGEGKRRVSCLSCHQMHGSDPKDQLRSSERDNESCLQCHEDFRSQLEQHTHHKPGTAGSLCYNCHMTHTSYALYTATRSHRIDSPNVEFSSKFGKPNGCNQCHQDKTLGWTAERLHDWYGTPLPKLSEEERTVSASLLWALKGDAPQRAITAWTLGWKVGHTASGDDWQAVALSHLLNDPYPAVRCVAYNSLRKLPAYETFEYDFVGSKSTFPSDVDRALQNWPGAKPRAESSRRALLLTSEGRPNDAAIRSLIKRRDNRPITLPE